MRISDWSSDVCSSDLSARNKDHDRHALIGNYELTIVLRSGRSQGSDRASIARSTKNAERPSISARPTHRHVHGPADRRKLQASNEKGLSGPAEAPNIPARSRRNLTTRPNENGKESGRERRSKKEE